MDPQRSAAGRDDGAASVRDGAEAQNAAACTPPPRIVAEVASSMRSDDIKQSDAASLAQELAMSSPWSDIFMPRIYGTSTTRPTNTHDSTNRHEPGNMYPLDPPPAYSNVPQVHELPADSVYNNPRAERPAPATPAIPSQRDNLRPPQPNDVEPEQTVETPLLGDVARWAVQPICNWWERRKMKKKRRQMKRRFCCFIFLLVLGGFSALFISGGYEKDNTWFSHPSRPSATFVPTGRVYERHSTLGSIQGSYKLYDRLDLSTITGSIDIEIDPQEGQLPAILSLSSDFGSVTVRVSSAYLRRRYRAQRTFQTTIRSLSGSVYAEILLGHGGFAFVDTTVGAQTISVIGQGLGPSEKVSSLTTLSKTGVQNVVLTSLEPASVPLTNIRAEHHVFGTGSMYLTYPHNWVGEVHAVVSSVGNIDVEGDRLDYSEDSDQEIRVRRGALDSTNLIEIVSEGTGSITFRC